MALVLLEGSFAHTGPVDGRAWGGWLGLGALGRGHLVRVSEKRGGAAKSGGGSAGCGCGVVERG